MAKKKLTDYKFDDHNFNLHTEEGMQLLDKSIEQFGFGRSVLADKNGVMIGGNGVMETAIRQGKTKVIEVETDGSELVVVKRKDIDINSEQGRAMAYADNQVAHKNLNWNEEELRKAQEEWNVSIKDWGGELPENVDIDDFFEEQSKNIEFKTKGKIIISIPDKYDMKEVKASIFEALKIYPDIKVK